MTPPPITVTCVYVRGEYPYTPEYVEKLHGMVARWTDRDFRFICLTDQPRLFAPPIETVEILKRHEYAPWAKLELFNPARGWTGRCAYFDLDVLIVAPLVPIVDAPAAFAITADPASMHKKPRTHDRFGRAIVRRFNSSVMVWDAGAHADLYTDWTPDVAERLSGDQDWIGEQLPEAYAMPRAWFPRLSEIGHGAVPADAKVVLVKVPKNHIAAEQYPWVDRMWRGAA